MSIYFIGNSQLVENENYKTSTIEECISYLESLDEIGLDFETTGFCPHQNDIISLQLGHFERQYVIDCSVVDIRIFKQLIETKLILGQNLKFDTRFLYKYNIWPTKVYDTFLAELVLNTGRENIGLSLKDLCNRYCNVDLDKSVRGNIHYEGLSTRVIIYAANDVKYLHDIKRLQEIKLKELDLIRILELENKHILALAYTEFCGFKLDVPQWIKNAKANKVKLESQKNLLTQWIIDNEMYKYIDNQLDLFSDEKKVTIEWSSSKQVIKLFKDLGIDTLARDKKTGEMKDSVEASHISKFKKQSTFIPIYLEYKEIEKQVSTYGESFLKYLNPVTKRLHSEFYPILDTGRISSNNPNLQNITADPDVRKCFIGEEGNTLIVSDYSAQEPRVLAALSNDSKLIDFFKQENADIHSFVASNMFSVMEGKEIVVTKADNTRRQIGKIMGLKLKENVNFLLNIWNLNLFTLPL